MKKILIIEDELIVRSIYRRKFEISGYQVETAEEGASALGKLSTFKPDAIQVDIMLPGMDGVEVIKQIRSWPEYKTTPILVISSFYRPDLAKEAWKAGATKCVSKMDCTPNLALELVEQMLGGEKVSKMGIVTGVDDKIRMLPADSPWESPTTMIRRKSKEAEQGGAAEDGKSGKGKPPTTLPNFARDLAKEKEKESDTAVSKRSSNAGASVRAGFNKPEPGGARHTTRPTFTSSSTTRFSKPAAIMAASAGAQVETPAAGSTEFRSEVRQEFFKRVPQLQVELRDRVAALLKSKSTNDQITLLRALETSISSLAGLSGITGFSRISHLSGAMDALIKDLHKKPAQMTGSVLRTIAHASDCLNMLFCDLEKTPREIPQSMLILAVDDEPIARRTISVALGKANLRCIGMEDPKAALAILKENPFDLIFLDAEMPGLTGFELCGELRKLPTNKATPVIFVTSLTKFEVRAQSSLAGGNDLIAKPFLMMELAVKALTYLLRPPATAEPKEAKPSGDTKEAKGAASEEKLAVK